MIADIEDGHYSLYFARNERVRAYHSNKVPLIVFSHQSETDIIKSDYNSVFLRPQFPAFKDCMKHILKGSSKFYYTSVKTIDPLQEYYTRLLERGIECQFFKHSPSMLSFNFTNVTLRPSTNKECTWTWIQDGENTWDGAFNIKLQQTQETSVDDSHHKDLLPVSNSDQDVIMAITCWIPSPSSRHYRWLQKMRRISVNHEKDNVAEKLGVTFAIPFILRNNSLMTSKLIHSGEIILDYKTSVIILSITALLFLLLVIAGYLFVKRNPSIFLFINI